MLLKSDAPKAVIRILVPKLHLEMTGYFWKLVGCGRLFLFRWEVPHKRRESTVHYREAFTFLPLEQPPECRKTVSTLLLDTIVLGALEEFPSQPSTLVNHPPYFFDFMTITSA